jgi:HTH-type transcriptional regulator, transcriptional repressor of NAD biosynthesis genes
MKRGLVIGKFLPIHLGHIALINFAATQCDELIVSISASASDSIDIQLRFSWLREIFKNNGRIKCFQVDDNFDNESLPLQARTKIWATFIRQKFPAIHIVVSSEEYGEPFARALEATHVAFDPERKQFPVSASLIRQNPFAYWEFIPAAVRPYFVKKLCFFGPESTGKSMMAEILAKKYETVFVPEVARELITSNEFTVEDIIKIGHAHAERLRVKTKSANKILFCDTDAITTQLYAQHYLHHVPGILFDLEQEVRYDHYFLFDIDVPWVADGLRDLGTVRNEMFAVFRDALEQRAIPYTLVRGDYEARQQLIEHWIEEHYSVKA